MKSSIYSIVFAVFGAIFALSADSQAVAQDTITVAAQFPDGSSISVPNIPAGSAACKSNVRLAMLNANYLNPKFTFQTSFYYPYGDYVTEINGWFASGSKYWACYVNGTLAPCGINTQQLNPGDTVVWTLISSSHEDHNPEAMQAQVFEMRKKKEAK